MVSHEAGASADKEPFDVRQDSREEHPEGPIGIVIGEHRLGRILNLPAQQMQYQVVQVFQPLQPVLQNLERNPFGRYLYTPGGGYSPSWKAQYISPKCVLRHDMLQFSQNGSKL